MLPYPPKEAFGRRLGSIGARNRNADDVKTEEDVLILNTPPQQSIYFRQFCVVSLSGASWSVFHPLLDVCLIRFELIFCHNLLQFCVIGLHILHHFLAAFLHLLS